jgi:hypothetical protein
MLLPCGVGGEACFAGAGYRPADRERASLGVRRGKVDACGSAVDTLNGAACLLKAGKHALTAEPQTPVDDGVFMDDSAQGNALRPPIVPKHPARQRDTPIPSGR